MNIDKAYLFLIRFILILIVFLGISLLVNSIIDTDKPDTENLRFIGISEESVDSVIALLTIEEKLAYLFQTETPLFSDTLVNPKTDSVLSYLSNNNSLTIAKGMASYPELKEPRFTGFNHHTGSDLFVLCAINDSIFISELIRSNADDTYFSNHGIWGFRLDTLILKRLNDSLYLSFFNRKLNYLFQTYQHNYRLTGFTLDKPALAILSQKKTGNNDPQKLIDILQTKADVLYLDSGEMITVLPFQFNGLLIHKANAGVLKNEESFIRMFSDKSDQIIVENETYQRFKTKALELIKNKQIAEKELNMKIRKSIKAKLWMDFGRNQNDCFDPKIHRSEYYTSRLAALSLTLVNNPDSILPIKYIHNKKFSLVWIGNTINPEFKKNCNHYVNSGIIQLLPGKTDWFKKIQEIQKQHFCLYVIDTLLTDTADVRQFKVIAESMPAAYSVVINIRNYGNLQYIPRQITSLQSYSNGKYDYAYAAQALFGGIPLNAGLPFRFSDNDQFGFLNHTPKTRLGYGIPEEVGIDASKLTAIDQIVNSAIASSAFPGCQVFVAKSGQVVYNKSFGHHTYSREIAVKETDMYDLASVTKIAATTIAAMKMITEGKISLNDVLGKFFKDTKIDYTRIKPDTVINIDTFYHSGISNWKSFLNGRDTLNLNDSSFVTIDTIIYKLTPRLNIFKVPLIDLLKHQSGIQPALPIFRYMYYRAYFIRQLKDRLSAMHGKTGPLVDFKSFELPENFPDNTKLDDSLKNAIKQGFKKQYHAYFSTSYVKDSSDIRLTDNLFLRNNYFDTIWRDTKQLPVFARKVFIYSDINMILLQLALDSLNRLPIDQYMKKAIYNPLGLKNISYLPLKFYAKNRIVPTEQEKAWRYGFLHGYVHDPSAALLGGVAGNAGLYSSARDLGVLFQMVLNNGSYGGIRYINASVIKLFTTRIDETQRGLGFDMPNRKAKVGTMAPKSTYGHSGYTGTCVWVDPENELVYVFLANRNHPNATNWRINLYRVRERVHDAIYQAMTIDDPNIAVAD